MNFVNFIKSCINPFKIDLVKYPNSDLRRRKKLLINHKITKILDVGANSGQYAKQTLKLGYKGVIMSFEPVKAVFNKLENHAQKNTNWKAFNFGLGNDDSEMTINISQNTYSSSLLDIMPTHVNGAPESKYINNEVVIIKKLDSISNEILQKDDVVLLKIDAQGFEKNILDGAKDTLKNIKGIQLEMSIEELYKGEMLFLDMVKYLQSLGYNLYSLENGFYNSDSGKLLQVDGLFFRD